MFYDNCGENKVRDLWRQHHTKTIYVREEICLKEREEKVCISMTEIH